MQKQRVRAASVFETRANAMAVQHASIARYNAARADLQIRLGLRDAIRDMRGTLHVKQQIAGSFRAHVDFPDGSRYTAPEGMLNVHLKRCDLRQPRPSRPRTPWFERPQAA